MKISTLFLFLIVIGSCNNNKEQNNDPLAGYATKGDSIVTITFDTLRNTLLKTIGEKGLAGALKFCNVQAMPITAIYASEGITVSRLTDKTRNAKNALSEFDKVQWDKFVALIAAKDSLKPVVVADDNNVHYYKPIILQGMCLSCHGTIEKDIPKELLPLIDSLYPGDKAKGYKTGDLRGAWHVVFQQKNVGG